MESNSIPVAPIDATKPVTGSRWNRNRIQLHGRSDRNYIHQVSPLLMKSYAEIGAFPHEYHIWESPCSTHYRQFSSAYMLHVLYSTSGTADRMNEFSSIENSLARLGISAMEFDTKGTYLASMTRSGCLTVHKFESLYSQSNESEQGKDEKKQLRHFSLSDPNDYRYDGISAIRWNPSDQDEIAYTSLCSGALTIFDIEYTKTVQVLSKRPPVSNLVSQGLSDVAFFDDGNRVLASDRSGAISMWDRRVSYLPQRVLTTKKNIGLTSIQLLGDQCVYGASESGFIYIWDLRRLRGGRLSAASQSDKEVHSSPQISVNLESMLNEVGPLKAQENIRSLMEIKSININPSCPYQLGFHLPDGWSGVLDMHNFHVSHIHCPPPPPGLDRNAAVFKSPSRKPSWLPKHSIYVAASTNSNGLHLVDFYPHSSSPCHVDYDDSKSMAKTTLERKQSVFVPLSKRVTACTVHPLSDAIVAGTMESSLLMISQKHFSKKGDDEDEHS